MRWTQGPPRPQAAGPARRARRGDGSGWSPHFASNCSSFCWQAGTVTGRAHGLSRHMWFRALAGCWLTVCLSETGQRRAYAGPSCSTERQSLHLCAHWPTLVYDSLCNCCSTAARLGTATAQPMHQGKQGSSAHAHTATPARLPNQPIHQRRPSGVSCGFPTGIQTGNLNRTMCGGASFCSSHVCNLQNVCAAGSPELGSDKRGRAQPHQDKQTCHAGCHGAAHTHCWYNASAQYVGRGLPRATD